MLARVRGHVRFQNVSFSYEPDDAAAEVCGAIRADLEAAGTPIGPSDLMIAAIARSRDLTLVTHNQRELARVPDLRLEDCEQPG